METPRELWPAVALFGAGLFLLLGLAYSTMLVSVSALSRVALHRLIEGSGRMKTLEGLREPDSTQRLAVGLGRQLCLLGTALLAALSAAWAGWGPGAVVGAATGAFLGALLIDVVGARSLALRDPRAALRWLAFLIPPTRVALYPIVQFAHLVLSRAVNGGSTTDEEREEEQDEEVEALIEVGEREGILEADGGQMMRGIVDLDETKIREIMTPRTDIVALPIETTIAECRRAVLQASHSRLPVYRETIDNVVGVLHERDLLRAWDSGATDRPISDFLREAMFVPESLSAAQLLSEMRLKTHMALVVDEYGGVAGLVTLEDLLEEIVGEIRDEHDDEEALVRQEPDGSWTVNAAAHVDELTELFGIEFDDRDFDTVGGLVVSQLGRVPAVGEQLRIEHLQIEVAEADRRRIRQVRVRCDAPSSEVGAGQ